ncbi:MAG: serine hydrolase [Planctomycetota bacterium]
MPQKTLLLLALLAPLAARLPSQTALDPARVEALARSAFEKFHPKGMALAVVQDGEPLVEIGLGERGDGGPVTPRTLFNIASCSKAFTAALVAMAVSEGKLGWDDPVVRHLPEFRMQDPWITAHMTIADLLSHRCGLVTFAGDLLWYGSDYSDEEVLARIDKLPIRQRFRDEFGYQNLMYMVAGMILGRIYQKPWEDLVEERILRPLGMEDSRACAQRLPEGAEKALPFIDGEPVEDHVFRACKPAAAMYSSVHDLVLWERLLLSGGKLGETRLLAGGALAELWRPRVRIGPSTGADPTDLRGYGMGWFVWPHRGAKLVEHDGGMPGFLSKVSLIPSEGFGFVVLNNANDGILNEAVKAGLLLARAGQDGEAGIARFARIAERVREREKARKAEREARRVPGTKPSLPLEAYAGRYEDEVYGPAEVSLAEGRLHVVLLPSRRRLHGDLSHWHLDVFRVDFPDRFLPFALFRFEIGTGGEVEGFRIDCPIPDFDFGALDFRRVRKD